MDFKPTNKPAQPSGSPANSNQDRFSSSPNSVRNPYSVPTGTPPNEPIGVPNASPSFGPPPKKPKKKLTKKQFIFIAIGIILLGIGLLVGINVIKGDPEQPEQPKAQIVEEKEEPKKPTSPLTGRIVASEALAKRPVTGIMVENSPASRPQSGLQEADMVYEAIAEAGVTRFMAVYQESAPSQVGPVRSARPYYLDYILGLDGTYAHVGGSPEALNDIRTLGVKDIDEFSNAATFWRASHRYMPHNAYTSFERLDKTNTAKGYTSSEFTPFIRKTDVPQTPKAAIVNVSPSGPNYNSSYNYQPDSNSYLRQMAGVPHSDEVSGKQINPKVIIALVVNGGTQADGYHHYYETSGNGKVLIFQDGIMSEGQWSKADRKASLTLKDKNGFPMALNAGQTWVTLIGSANDVSYSAQ